MKERLTIKGYDLVLTCGAMPEQYDVFLGVQEVGYLRLRHGHFYAETPHVGGARVYEADPQGEGQFLDRERMGFLTAAVEAIDLHLKAKRKA